MSNLFKLSILCIFVILGCSKDSNPKLDFDRYEIESQQIYERIVKTVNILESRRFNPLKVNTPIELRTAIIETFPENEVKQYYKNKSYIDEFVITEIQNDLKKFKKIHNEIETKISKALMDDVAFGDKSTTNLKLLRSVILLDNNIEKEMKDLSILEILVYEKIIINELYNQVQKLFQLDHQRGFLACAWKFLKMVFYAILVVGAAACIAAAIAAAAASGLTASAAAIAVVNQCGLWAIAYLALFIDAVVSFYNSCIKVNSGSGGGWVDPCEEYRLQYSEDLNCSVFQEEYVTCVHYIGGTCLFQIPTSGAPQCCCLECY